MQLTGSCKLVLQPLCKRSISGQPPRFRVAVVRWRSDVERALVCRRLGAAGRSRPIGVAHRVGASIGSCKFARLGTALPRLAPTPVRSDGELDEADARRIWRSLLAERADQGRWPVCARLAGGECPLLSPPSGTSLLSVTRVADSCPNPHRPARRLLPSGLPPGHFRSGRASRRQLLALTAEVPATSGRRRLRARATASRGPTHSGLRRAATSPK